MDERLLTVREAAQLIGVAQATLRKWTAAGLLDASRTVGGHRRYTRAAIDAFIARGLSGESAGQPANLASYGAYRPLRAILALALMLLSALPARTFETVAVFA